MRPFNTEMTLRDREAHEWEMEVLGAQMDHAKQMKLLEIEVLKTEARIVSWFKIPLVIITLPVRVLLVVPLSIYAITHQEVPEFYKKFMS